MAIKSINPATGKVYKTYTPLTPEEIEKRLVSRGRLNINNTDGHHLAIAAPGYRPLQII